MTDWDAGNLAASMRQYALQTSFTTIDEQSQLIRLELGYSLQIVVRNNT